MLTKNSGKWLRKVLIPIAANIINYDIHLVFVDGYSTDDTVTLAKSYFSNLIVLESKSRNLADLRNIALAKASELNCDYSCFIDSDVVVPTNFFERMIQLIEVKKAGIVGLRFELEQDPALGFVAKYYRHRTDITRKGIYVVDYTTTACSMWKTSLATNVILDSRFRRAGEDVDFNLQLTRQGYKAYVDADDPPAWHIRSSTVHEELHRVKDHGYSRALNVNLHDNMSPSRYEKTIFGSLLAIIGFIGFFSFLWVGLAVFFLAWLVLFGRQMLKTTPKWRLDYVGFGWLIAMIYYVQFFRGVVALNLKRY